MEARPAGDGPWERVARFGPRLVDLALLGGMALCVLVDLFTMNDLGLARLQLLASVVALGLVTVRRVHPLPTFLAAVAVVGGLTMARWLPLGSLVITDYPLIAPVAALGALATPVVRREAPAAAALAATAGAVAVLALLAWPMPVTQRILLTIGFGGTYTIGVGAGVYLRDLDDRERRAALTARRDERMDLARELHDLVAHYVTGIVVQAQAAQVVADRDPAAADRALHRIEGAGKDALAAMRRLVGSLRDEAGTGPGGPVAPPVGLAGLHDLVADAAGAGVPVQLHLQPEALAAVPGAVAASAQRIVQESITNARRHAVGASRVEADLRLAGAHLLITVTDDGRPPVGGPRADGRGYGLVGMQERAHALGGDLRAGPVPPPGHGWRVRARLPLGPVAP